MPGKEFMHGHSVLYDEEDEHGFHYLNELDPETAKTFFDHAKFHGAAEFKDLHGRPFVLQYNHDGTYGIMGNR